MPSVSILVGLALLLNATYLASYSSASVFHYANVGAHVMLGLLAPLTLWSIARRAAGRWGVSGALAAAALGVAMGAGIYLAWVGGGRAHDLARHVHAGVSAAAAVLVAAWVLILSGRRAVGAVSRGAAMATVALVVLATAGAVVARATVPGRQAASFRITNPALPPLTMEEEGGGARSPFFPSSAKTSVGGVMPADFFMTSKECGRCHREIYEQWQSSTHHFSSFNNQWYRKSIEYMQDVAGVPPSKWCAGCHDHAMFFNGRFDRPVKEQIETPEAQNGLGCTSCHAIVHVDGTMGQGGFTVEYPALHDLATSSNPVLMKAHDALLHMSPAPHRQTFLKPFHTEQPAQFCSACHKVHLDKPVNNYRWFRGFNDYDNWQASAVSGEGARSFYYPPKPQTCSDCHMPWVPSQDPAARNGRVRSHRFIAANTALPYVNGDAEQLRLTQEFLKAGQISVDVFGLARVEETQQAWGGNGRDGEPRLSSTFAVGEEGGDSAVGAAGLAPVEVVGPLGTVDASVRRGDSVRVEVVVRTRKVGHFFPGGTVDAFEVWVEFEAVDDHGRVLLHSGDVADGGSGPVDPGAHLYRSLQLDGHGNPISKRNAWSTRSVAYVRLIGPGSADTVHYRMRVPPDAGHTITLRAKVKHRKFAWWNTQWAYAGVRAPGTPAATRDHDDGQWVFTGDTSKVSGPMKRIPALPITVMATAQATVSVLPKGAPLTSPRRLDPSVRERWNDYGIGLLQQGDLKNAEAAFLNVMASEPGYADGPLNVARVRLQEGDLEGAELMLRKSLTINGSLARTHYFLGTALKGLGRYDEAITHYEQTVAQYPKDRVALNQLGRVLFLQRKFEPAIAVFRRVLAIDPEDLQAHYNLMLCYQGTGQDDMAAKEETLYLRFKADEGSQAIAGDFSRTSPEDNNERQNIHEHGK